MKKLLITSDSGLPRWDGVARFLYEIVPRIRGYFETTVVTPGFKGGKYLFKDTVNVKIPTFRFSIADYTPPKPPFRMMSSLVKDKDIIFVQTLGPIGALSIIKGSKIKKKIVAYVHSIEWELVTKAVKLPNGLTKKLYSQIKIFVKKMYEKCDLLLVPTEDIMKILEKENIKTRKVIIPLGVDLKRFRPSKNKRASKKAVGLEDNFIIGFAGRIAREKDLPTLFKAFENVRKKIKCKLLIVGTGIRDYDKIIKENKDIIATGNINNVEDYLRAMDVFVLPSLTETSSSATMEAMASGLPCITTPVGIMRKKIVNLKNGIKFTPGDSEGLAKKIIYLYKNKKLRQEIGRNARRTMLNYSWDTTAKRIIRELNNL